MKKPLWQRSLGERGRRAADGARNAVGFVAVAAQDILIRSSKTISDRTATSSSSAAAADVTRSVGAD